MEHLQRVWLASRERLPFRTPGSVPILGLANAPIVETKFLEIAMSLLDFSPRIPLGTFSILLANLRSSAWLKTDFCWQKWILSDRIEFYSDKGHFWVQNDFNLYTDIIYTYLYTEIALSAQKPNIFAYHDP